MLSDELIDALVRFEFTGAEYKVILAVAKRTVWLGRNWSEISYAEMAQFTNLTRRHVIRVMENLRKRRVLRRYGIRWALELDASKWGIDRSAQVDEFEDESEEPEKEGRLMKLYNKIIRPEKLRAMYSDEMKAKLPKRFWNVFETYPGLKPPSEDFLWMLADDWPNFTEILHRWAIWCLGNPGKMRLRKDAKRCLTNWFLKEERPADDGKSASELLKEEL